MLTAIVGKTVEQSMTEVLQEEELLRARYRRYDYNDL